MEQRISLITLGVEDLGRARDFYENGLGWRPAFTNEEVAFYQLNGVVFALFLRSELLADANLPDRPPGVEGIALAYNVRSRAEVDDLLATAERAGAIILKPARETPWGGYSGYFADPDSHTWEVAWNPAWQIDAEGNVNMRA